MNIYLVLPAYNEEKGLSDLLPHLTKFPYSIVVVDDCSSDNTSNIIRSFSNIHLVSNKINLGYAASLLLGINKAFSLGASHVITLDSDGQHPLHAIPSIVNFFMSGSDCVLTIRNALKPRFSERIIAFISSKLWGVPDLYSGMRGFSRFFWQQYFRSNLLTSCLEYPFVHALSSGFRPDLLFIQPLSRIEGPPRFAALLSADFIILKSFIHSFLSK